MAQWRNGIKAQWFNGIILILLFLVKIFEMISPLCRYAFKPFNLLKLVQFLNTFI